jgi:ABC-2 type transport system ATP-binding protein
LDDQFDGQLDRIWMIFDLLIEWASGQRDDSVSRRSTTSSKVLRLIVQVRIRVENVDFSFGRNRVLAGVDWTIDTGVTGLLGPNGAGKTTLLNLLVGLTKPSAGRIAVEDAERRAGHTATYQQRLVGFVPQRFSLVGEMRVIDTVSYAAWVNGVPRKRCADAAVAALEVVQLADFAQSRVRALSGGQRQRVGVAAALAHEPDVLILDEPTVGLDPGQRLRLREVIAEIGRTRTVLLSTHLIEDISHLCTRVGVLAGGRLAFDGTEEELTALIDHSATSGTLGSPFERAYNELVNRLGAARD